MTNRERYFGTILFGNPDKVLFSPGCPRESTLKAWRQQGMPDNADYMDIIRGDFGLSDESKLKVHNAGISFKMIPTFEPEILCHKNEHYIIRDWMGAITEVSDKYDHTYLTKPKDFVTRKWHKFPVETREDWQQMKLRFNPDTEERIIDGAISKALKAASEDLIISTAFNGVFWQLREWCGFENLCIKFAEEPEFVSEMAEFWTDFIIRVLNRFSPFVSIDHVMINEDMAFKAHSMISPQMTREFIKPAYVKWVEVLKKHGCQVIELDCDGYIGELIPIWIESGINYCSPVEVAAHNDIIKFRKIFGRQMAYYGGIDKRLIALGGAELFSHIMSIIPHMFKEGGYIPSCDHGVPPDISWKNFKEYAGLLAKLSGWL